MNCKMINRNSKIFLAGHNGLVGSAILRKLKNKNYKKIITINRKKLDLRDQNKVFKYLKKIKPRAVIVAAATVGGIKHNNDYKANFIYDNLSIVLFGVLRFKLWLDTIYINFSVEFC